jgi:hypothetical protein
LNDQAEHVVSRIKAKEPPGMDVESLRVLIVESLLALLFAASASFAGETQVRQVPPRHPAVPEAADPETLALSPDFDPPLGTYFYTIKWKGAGVAEACLQLLKEDDTYRIEVRVRTGKVIDKVYKLRFHGYGYVKADELAPLKTYLSQRGGTRKRVTNIAFDPEGAATGVVVRTKRDRNPRKVVTEVDPGDETIGPFAGSLLARSLAWQVGLKATFEVFMGKDRHLITFLCVGRQKLQVGDTQRECWVIEPSAQRVDKAPGEDPPVGTMRVYLSNDPAREVLRIETRSKVGTVRVSLDKFAPVPENGVPVRCK